mmetsp:Transcript_39575/g.100371  ORF Transcript_39575/g.100371 Transcript_39575/m.100371 type:complete len:329 (+) Transcript_39575:430-1416(+)
MRSQDQDAISRLANRWARRGRDIRLRENSPRPRETASWGPDSMTSRCTCTTAQSSPWGSALLSRATTLPKRRGRAPTTGKSRTPAGRSTPWAPGSGRRSRSLGSAPVTTWGKPARPRRRARTSRSGSSLPSHQLTTGWVRDTMRCHRHPAAPSLASARCRCRPRRRTSPAPATMGCRPRRAARASALPQGCPPRRRRRGRVPGHTLRPAGTTAPSSPFLERRWPVRRSAVPRSSPARARTRRPLTDATMGRRSQLARVCRRCTRTPPTCRVRGSTPWLASRTAPSSALGTGYLSSPPRTLFERRRSCRPPATIMAYMEASPRLAASLP